MQVGLEGMIDGCHGEAGSLNRRKTDEKLSGKKHSSQRLPVFYRKKTHRLHGDVALSASLSSSAHGLAPASCLLCHLPHFLSSPMGLCPSVSRSSPA